MVDIEIIRKIKVSNHARTRLQERGIDIVEIIRIVNMPIDTITYHDGDDEIHKVYGKAIDPYTKKSKYLMIIYKKLDKPDDRDNSILLITALWISRGGLEKYGFTQTNISDNL